ncbi:hypothetical protein K8I61_07040, partial [bacterium]|nr:hypothetical protein [bacterium]
MTIDDRALARLAPTDSPRGAATVFLAFVLLTFLVYGGGIRGPFLYDDDAYISGNPTIKDLSRAFATFGRPEALTGGQFNHLAYRPLMPIVYAILYALFGDATPGYHAANLIIHAAAGVFAFLVMRRMRIDPRAALVGAAIWLLHPVHVENVASVSGLDDILAAVFAMGAILGVLGARPVAAAVFFALALMAKESALVAPALAFAVLALHSDGPIKTRLVDSARRILPLLLVAAAYLLVREHFLPFLDEKAPARDTATALLLMPQVFLTYVRLFFLPVDLRINYFYDVERLVTPPFFMGAALMAALFAGVAWTRRREPRVAAGLLWFFLAFLPVSNLIPLRALAGERFLYLPFVGSMIAVAAIGARARGRVAGMAAIVTIAAFALLSADRVRIWCDEEVFWKDIIAKEPRFSEDQVYESSLA